MEVLKVSIGIQDLIQCFSGHTLGKTVTQADVDFFKQLTRYQPDSINCGVETIPEFLITMVSIGLMNRLGFLEGNLVAVMENEWQYLKKAKINDTFTVAYQIIDVFPNKKGDKEAMVFELETLNQENALIANGIWKVMMRK